MNMIIIVALDLHYSYNGYLDMDWLLRVAQQQYLYACLAIEVERRNCSEEIPPSRIL